MRIQAMRPHIRPIRLADPISLTREPLKLREIEAVEIALRRIPLCGAKVVVLSAHCCQLPAKTLAKIAGSSTFEAIPSSFADQICEEEEGNRTAGVVGCCGTDPVYVGLLILQ